MDDWSDLDVFHAVAEEGSFAAAARRLKISHPTVGRRLDALERRLGALLVMRGAGGVELTEFGHAIADNVRRMGLEAEAIRRRADGGEQGLAGLVSVTAIDGIGVMVVTRVLAELRDAHPDLLIHLDISIQPANLARREADIAVRLGKPGDQASLIARRVARIGGGYYAAPSYLDARGRPQTVADLAEHDAVQIAANDRHSWMARADGAIIEPRRVTFESVSPTAVFAAVEAGMGVGAQSHWRARGAASLERVLPDVELPPIDLWLVTHADMRRNTRIRLVFDHLADRLSANARYFREGDPDIAAPIA
ncbi:MAG: LysR family transcriptional regulator [Caulobacterales bacterium]|nr:LysR family transcriptional regulator [Caulobacterales bacterium]